MLIVTRRPGESVLIGDSIEVRIVDADWREPDARCAISIVDEKGDELALRCSTKRDGTAVVHAAQPRGALLGTDD